MRKRAAAGLFVKGIARRDPRDLGRGIDKINDRCPMGSDSSNLVLQGGIKGLGDPRRAQVISRHIFQAFEAASS